VGDAGLPEGSQQRGVIDGGRAVDRVDQVGDRRAVLGRAVMVEDAGHGRAAVRQEREPVAAIGAHDEIPLPVPGVHEKQCVLRCVLANPGAGGEVVLGHEDGDGVHHLEVRPGAGGGQQRRSRQRHGGRESGGAGMLPEGAAQPAQGLRSEAATECAERQPDGDQDGLVIEQPHVPQAEQVQVGDEEPGAHPGG